MTCKQSAHLSKAAKRLDFYLLLQDFLSDGPPTVSKIVNRGMPGLGNAREVTRAADELGLRVETRWHPRGASLRVVGGMLTEHQEQCELMVGLRELAAHPQYRDAGRVFAIPNGGHRVMKVAVQMKREGAKKGVPDLMLPAARSGWPGLFIEMKRIKGGTVSEDQKDWISYLDAQGYCAVVCRGAENALEVIRAYLDGEGVWCSPAVWKTAGDFGAGPDDLGAEPVPE